MTFKLRRRKTGTFRPVARGRAEKKPKKEKDQHPFAAGNLLRIRGGGEKIVKSVGGCIAAPGVMSVDKSGQRFRGPNLWGGEFSTYPASIGTIRLGENPRL